MNRAPSPTRSGLTLAVIAAVCALLVATTHRVTAERIAANERQRLERNLRPVLAGVAHDNDLLASRLTLPPPHGLPGPGAAIIYRAYANGEPAAALFVVTAMDGYAGPIRLLLGIRADGTVSGLRVLDHRETPGLGDRIETERTDWSLQFHGRSLDDPPVEDWAIRVDGGDFDQLTGASITPRAVIKAVRETLLYFAAHREVVFAAPAETTDP